MGVFGLVTQEENSKKVKPIYVHSKVAIIDDTLMINGSTNMDNISFFYCSEVSAAIYNPDLAGYTRVRLGREHLGKYWDDRMIKDPKLMFDAFCSVATENMKHLKRGSPLVGRPIWMAPAENYDFLMKAVYYPNKLAKFLYKMGISTEELSQRFSNVSAEEVLPKIRARF